MNLFIGEKFRNFIAGIDSIETDGAAENADKIIITCDCEQAVEAVKIAKAKKIPVLAIVDGYKAVVDAFGGKLNDASSTINTGNQEWAVIDATSPVYVQ